MSDDFSGDLLDADHYLRLVHAASLRKDYAAMANLALEAVKHMERVELWARRQVRDGK